MATFAEALLVWCEECDAEKGQPCTYIIEREIRARTGGKFVRNQFGEGWYWQPPPIIKIIKIGDPTDRPHNKRFNRAEIKFHRAPMRKRPPVRRPSEWRMEIARAENTFDRREQRKVFAWLSQYASILQIKEES